MPIDREPHDLTDLPLQPTGSGVADAEMARLQDEIADLPGSDETDAEADRPTRTQA